MTNDTVKLDQIQLDKNNANRHTERGQEMVRRSVKRHGFAEAGTLDKNNRVIGGNLRKTIADDMGTSEAVIIDVDGSKPVFIRRNDLDLADAGDTKARELAYALNRGAQVSIDLSAEQIIADAEAGLDLSDMFDADEMMELEEEALLSESLAMAMSGEAQTEKTTRHLGERGKQIKPVLYAEEIKTFEEAMRNTGIKNRGQALITICEFYLDNEERQLDL